MDLVKDSVFNQKFDTESEVIDIKKYFDEFVEFIPQFELCKNCTQSKGCGVETCETDAAYRNFMGINQDELNQLKERISIDHLKCEDEVEYYKKDDLESVLNNEKKTPEAGIEHITSPLESVQKRWEMTNVTKSEFRRTFYKYCNYEWCHSDGVNNVTNTKSDFNSLEFSTVVACIKVYHPFTSKRSNPLKVKLLQEIHILGQQTLAHFKDKIVCSYDYIGGKDLSNECFLKNIGHNVTAKDEYPSSFIFIEDTFYNDTRSNKMNDISSELKKWAEERKLGKFQTAKMETTQIQSLKVKLGRPYVYQHQGNCEHIIIFSDIRLLDSTDPNNFGSFPRIHCTGRIYGKHCMMCADYYARWLVVGNERLIHERAYLCDKCFISYNYVDGRKIGSFEAYKYIDPVAIL